MKTMRTLVTAVVTIMAFATSIAVHAEAPENDPRALEALKNFAICAADLTPDGARKLLALDPNGPEYAKALRTFTRGHSRCMQGNSKFRFAGLPFAGFLAEALLQRDTILPALHGETAPAANLVEAVGACVAREKPVEVAAIFETVPGSRDEIEALKPTGEALKSCIRDGQTITLNRAAIRAMCALGVYRQLHPLQSKSEG
jgi:hypothetical protein